MSREIIKKSTGSVTIFAFDEGQGLREHTAPFDALVQVVEGEAEIVISCHPHRLQCGEMILMASGGAGGNAAGGKIRRDSAVFLGAEEGSTGRFSAARKMVSLPSAMRARNAIREPMTGLERSRS